MASEILNDNQRRHYYVLLSMLAQSLARLRAVANASSDGLSLVAYDDDLPQGFLERIEPQLHSLRQSLTRLADTIGIQPKRLSRRNSVRAILVTEIVRIEDSLSGGLKGYGDVDPRVRSLLDPMLQSVIKDLQAMRSVLEGRHEATGHR